ncbi:MAG: GYD domain-containing protein [Rhodospirillales bacterium]|jgi:uncharacterized protein with GYD domain|nr:hypothetical protein [Rhodospirillaceae bacterium]MDP6428520.1 GYD domain-containing protein [Rhodospirillales bacterium]MDP6646162.1 GYD domain-containing protein [Rhodospirillales bacterium]MDP6843450.1 GYD domain-containing protein [Rhodospirillales bacterium]|tara:strand:+ start:335 stop:610 length:276 start_codon:yes stop_codon:yes gene_type:complete
MKYVLLGSLSAEWTARHDERIASAKAKLDELGITLESNYYIQGAFDFVDVLEGEPEALLAFSVWYGSQGYGKVLTCPAFDSDTLARAVKNA